MATERQIAANRRNALQSTGPRTSAGKRRARRNSYRHGLSVGAAGRPGSSEHVERLARKIAGPGADPLVLEQARSAAHGQLDLIKIRRMRVSPIQRTAEFGTLDIHGPLGTRRDMETSPEINRSRAAVDLSVPPAPSMPSSEPDRAPEAIRRALPELLKLDRYERSAAGRRDKAARLLAARRIRIDNQ
jgi:hypothetical protein